MSLFFSIESDFNFSKTVELLKSAIIASKFSVLAEINLSEKFRLRNLPYEGDLLVLEVCNPAYAFSVLESNEEARFLLPCRITISGKSDISVGMINFEDFKNVGYKLSESEIIVLNEIKQLISVVVDNHK